MNTLFRKSSKYWLIVGERLLDFWGRLLGLCEDKGTICFWYDEEGLFDEKEKRSIRPFICH